jgi:hypothetical protein
MRVAVTVLLDAMANSLNQIKLVFVERVLNDRLPVWPATKSAYEGRHTGRLRYNKRGGLGLA